MSTGFAALRVDGRRTVDGKTFPVQGLGRSTDDTAAAAPDEQT